MKKFKKIVLFFLVAIMMFSLLAFSGCSEPYEFTEGDFELTVTMDRDTFSKGDNAWLWIGFEATLTNLSNKSHRITYWNWLMSPHVTPEVMFPSGPHFFHRRLINIEANEAITRAQSFEAFFSELGVHELTIYAIFVFGRRLSWRHTSYRDFITIQSNTIKFYIVN